MIFWSILAGVAAYLLLVIFIFSTLFAWWDRSADRKSEAKHLREFAAARALARYQHRPEHTCGLLGDTNLVHIDSRCIAWTMKIEAVAAELQRHRLRVALLKLAERKTARAVTRAENDHPVH